jgi:hypothetical protein
VTREVVSGRKTLPQDLVAAGIMTVIGGVLGAGFVALNLRSLFNSDPQYIAHIVLLMIGYALVFVGKGVLAGARQFAKVGWAMVIETTARLAAAVVFLTLATSATSLGWAMVAGGFAVLVLRWWKYDNGDRQAPASPSRGFLSGYAGGTASSQLLLGVHLSPCGAWRFPCADLDCVRHIHPLPGAADFDLRPAGAGPSYLVGLARTKMTSGWGGSRDKW